MRVIFGSFILIIYFGCVVQGDEVNSIVNDIRMENGVCYQRYSELPEPFKRFGNLNEGNSNHYSCMHLIFFEIEGKYTCINFTKYTDENTKKVVNFIEKSYCCNGYTLIDSSYEYDYENEKLICKPDCNPECINGECVAPGVCKCPTELILQADNRTCAYNCGTKCNNGDCIGNDICDCHKGYTPSEENDSDQLCVPLCKPECINSNCTAPKHCECYEHYKPGQVLNQCDPICDPLCVNSDCVGPNICECHLGYIKSMDKAVNECVPFCDDNCNGVCVEPNKCNCSDGYEWKNKECRPMCHPECTNGKCTAPNVCDCFEGFKQHLAVGKLSTDRPNTCIPHCTNCTNGECVAPNDCKCSSDYQLINGDCQPICDPPCGNGSCTSGHFCKCDNGYVKSFYVEQYRCKPYCINCHNNAKCVAPDTCECKHGYETISSNPTLCKPICDTECPSNSYCIEPNKCSCDYGYVRNETTGNCDPHCYPPCHNGNCVEPNKCECHKGYQKADFSEHTRDVCISDVAASCLKNISHSVKEVQYKEEYCYTFDKILRLYDERCEVEFANNTCYDTFNCLDDMHTNPWYTVCNSTYRCNIHQTFNNKSKIFGSCIWVPDSSEDVEELEESLQLHFVKHRDYLFPSFSSLMGNSMNNLCLLCLCPMENLNDECVNGRIDFKLCQCPTTAPYDDNTVPLYNSTAVILVVVAVTCTIILLLIAILLIMKRRRNGTELSFINAVYKNNSEINESSEVRVHHEDGHCTT